GGGVVATAVGSAVGSTVGVGAAAGASVLASPPHAARVMTHRVAKTFFISFLAPPCARTAPPSPPHLHRRRPGRARVERKRRVGSTRASRVAAQPLIGRVSEE